MRVSDEIETERLRLRPYGAGDLDLLAGMYADEAVTAFTLLGRHTRAEAKETLDGYLRTWRDVGYGMRAAFRKHDGAFVGECGLFIRSATGETALRYALLPRCWGLGLATEAVRATLDDAFAAKGLPRVDAVVQVENAASRRVMEKLGIGTVRTARGRHGDLLIYTLTREEWLAMAEPQPSGNMAR